MNKKILRIVLVVAIIIGIIFTIRIIKEANQGTPNQSQKGMPKSSNESLGQ
jgi:uncharacterized alpha/beta hydrolase family protein